jgi:hypothetical protein
MLSEGNKFMRLITVRDKANLPYKTILTGTSPDFTGLILLDQAFFCLFAERINHV